MRRFLFSVLLIIGSFVLQTTLFQALSFGGIVPNLSVVCYVIFFSDLSLV